MGHHRSAVHWGPELHPRDEHGKFRDRAGVSGPMGHLDLMAMRVDAKHHGDTIHRLEHNLAPQDRDWQRRDAGQLTPEEDVHWDALVDQAKTDQASLPPAYTKHHLRPSVDGAWYQQTGDAASHDCAHDEDGHRLPPVAMRGAVRVGDRPDGPGHTSVPGEHPM